MNILVRHFGRCEYVPTWQAMQAFTAARGPGTLDELWLLEHPPVYTLGQAGKPEHLLTTTSTPLVPIDRGGQITWHGPGQVVIYLLIDLNRRRLKVRELVQRIEQAVIDTLAGLDVPARREPGAPGVYLDNGAKIGALGLKVRGGCTYHGVSLNVSNDLSPFAAINPCGYPGLAVTRLADLGLTTSPDAVATALAQQLILQLEQPA